MRRTSLSAAAVLILLGGCGTPDGRRTASAFTGQWLVNGGLELSEYDGSKDIGPGWILDYSGDMRVFGKGAFDGKLPGFTPRSGRQAIGVVCDGKPNSGRMTQPMKVRPGGYDMEFAGHFWLRGESDGTYMSATVMVDGKAASKADLSVDDPGFKSGEWIRVTAAWSGPVRESVEVVLECAVKGSSSGSGGCAADDMTLSVKASAESLPEKSTPYDGLTNGDFEDAGEIGTADIGPGWVTDKAFKVVGPDGHHGILPDPLNKWKAVGLVQRDGLSGGKIEQAVPVRPGTHKVVATGHVWMVDTTRGPYVDSYLDARLLVDGQQVRAAKNVCDPQKQWYTLRYEWYGPVKREVRISLFARADARGPAGSYAGILMDSWQMTITPDAPPAPNLFVNGDFEEAGEPGTRNPGPGWVTRNPLQVFDAGSPPMLRERFSSYDGQKAMGVVARANDGHGMIEQTAKIKPGKYTLTLTGHLWLTDTFGGDALNTHCEVFFSVDKRVVQYKRVYCGSPKGPGDRWGDLKWTWTGEVKESSGVKLNLQARGRGPDTSWGMAFTDGWRLTALPVTKLPAETSILANGDFEKSGAIGSPHAGADWTVDPDEHLKVINNVPYDKMYHPFDLRAGSTKCVGVVANSVNNSGFLKQNIPLAPGEYDLYLSGWMWLFNNHGGGEDNVFIEVEGSVDGKRVMHNRTYAGDEEFPDCYWGLLPLVWSGRVEKEFSFTMDLQCRGRGPETSWGVTALDDWTFHAVRVDEKDRPQVVEAGIVPNRENSLYARWKYRRDPGGPRPVVNCAWGRGPDDSPIFMYAIGTAPGNTDVVEWTNVGNLTEITETSVELTPGRKYYWSVKALNPDGLFTRPGSSDAIECAP